MASRKEENDKLDIVIKMLAQSDKKIDDHKEESRIQHKEILDSLTGHGERITANETHIDTLRPQVKDSVSKSNVTWLVGIIATIAGVFGYTVK